MENDSKVGTDEVEKQVSHLSSSSSSGNSSDTSQNSTAQEKKATKRRTMVHWRVEPYRSQMVQAICLVRQSGMSTKSVAERFKIPPRTLRRYVSDPSRLGLDIVFPAFEKRRRRRKSTTKKTTTPRSSSPVATELCKTPRGPDDKIAVSRKSNLLGNIEWEIEEDDEEEDRVTTAGGESKVKLNHSRRWTVEPYRSQMLRAISMIQQQGISTTQVASMCGIPARTLRRYLNNTIKLHKMLKENGISSSLTSSSRKKKDDAIDMSSVMNLMSLGNVRRRKKRSRSFESDGSSGGEIQPSGRYHHLASPRNTSSSLVLDGPRGSAVGWTTRKRSLSSESLEMRGKQIQHAMMYSKSPSAITRKRTWSSESSASLEMRARTWSSESLEMRAKQIQYAMMHSKSSSITSADAAQQLLRMPTLMSQQRKQGDHVMICLESSSLLEKNDDNNDDDDDDKSKDKKTPSVPVPKRWVAGEVTNVRTDKNGSTIIDVTYGKDGEKKKTASILESKGHVVDRLSCGWSKHPCGVGFVRTQLSSLVSNDRSSSLVPNDQSSSLVPNDDTPSSVYTGRSRRRSRAMSWSVGDENMAMPRLMKARSSSMEDPRIIASAFILTQIACPPLAPYVQQRV